MKPVKLTNAELEKLDHERLSELQRKYVQMRLSGVSCATIAEREKVSLQYVYKVLWAAVETNNYTGTNPQFAQLSRPQHRCIYKTFALELKRRKIKSYEIAEQLNLPRNVISTYLYGKKPIPLNVAIKIQQQFFPDLTLEYLFAHSGPMPIALNHAEDGYEFFCVYPNLKKAMKENNVSLSDMAAALAVSTERILAILASGNGDALTYSDAHILQSFFFPNYNLLDLFALSPPALELEQ